MTAPEPWRGAPTWQQYDWEHHVARVVHWCAACEVHVVMREGATCPVCSSKETTS